MKKIHFNIKTLSIDLIILNDMSDKRTKKSTYLNIKQLLLNYLLNAKIYFSDQ